MNKQTVEIRLGESQVFLLIFSDSGQKTFKRRRSIINWAFWRGSSTHLDNLPMSPTSPMPGQLFGVSLPDICENDNLPKPILVSVLWVYKPVGKEVSEGEMLQGNSVSNMESS